MVMVNAVFRYCWFVGLVQSYMCTVLFDSELDGPTALPNTNDKSDVWLTVHRNSVWIRKTN